MPLELNFMPFRFGPPMVLGRRREYDAMALVDNRPGGIRQADV
jgi:hypothetical protein